MLFTNTNLPARLLLIGWAIFSLQGCQTPDPCAAAYEEGDRPYMRCQQANREFQKTMDKARADAHSREAQRQAAYDASSEGQAKKQAERRLVESIQNLTQSVQTAANQVAARRAEQARQQEILADNQARAQAEQQRQAQQQAQLVAEQQANADNQRRLIREQEIRNTVSTRPVEVADIAGTQSSQAPDLRKLASSRPGMAAPPEIYRQPIDRELSEQELQQGRKERAELAAEAYRKSEADRRAAWEQVSQHVNQVRAEEAEQQRQQQIQQQRQIASDNAQRRAAITQSNALVILSVERDGTVRYANNTPYHLRFSFDYRFECIGGDAPGVTAERYSSGLAFPSNSSETNIVQPSSCIAHGGRAVNISVKNLQWRDNER